MHFTLLVPHNQVMGSNNCKNCNERWDQLWLYQPARLFTKLAKYHVLKALNVPVYSGAEQVLTGSWQAEVMPGDAVFMWARHQVLSLVSSQADRGLNGPKIRQLRGSAIHGFYSRARGNQNDISGGSGTGHPSCCQWPIIALLLANFTAVALSPENDSTFDS